MTRALLGSVVGTVILTASTATANGVSARAVNTWSTDGYVNGAAAANGVVYIGGSFSSLGPNTGALAVVDRTTNLPIDWPRFTGGSVANVLPDADGGYLVQGSFRFVNGHSANGLVRLTAGGEVDPAFQWTPTAPLTAAFLAGDRLLVTAYLGSAMVSAIVDRRTGQVIAGPLPLTIRGAGTAPDGSLIAWVVGPTGQSGVVQLNPTTGAIERVIYVPSTSYGLSAMTVSGAQAFVATGGGFTSSGEVLRIDLTSGAATTLATVTGTYSGRIYFPAVSQIVHHRGRLYLQGNITSVNGTVLNWPDAGAAAIDATTGALTPWRRAASAYGASLLAADGDRLIFGSTFVAWQPSIPTVGGPGLVALDAETGAETGWRLPVLSSSGAGRPTAVIAEPSRLVIGGAFVGVGTTRRSGLAAISLPDGQPTDWNPVADRVHNVTVSESRVFTVEGDVNRVREYDAGTGARAAWSAATTGQIRRMAVSANRLFIVGPFTAVDGLPRNGAASFDLTTSPPTLEAWTAPFGPTDVTAIHVLPQAVLLGGAFPTGADGPIHRLLALDPSTGAALPWFPVVNDRIGQGFSSMDLAVTADRMFVSGFFDSVNGQPRPRLALFDFGGRLLPWQVDDARGISPSARLTLFEDRAYLTGECCGNPVGVAFDLASGQRTDWVPIAGPGSSGGRSSRLPGAGLLRYAFTSDSDEAGYTFYPRIPTVPAVTGLRGAVTGSLVQICVGRRAGRGALRHRGRLGARIVESRRARHAECGHGLCRHGRQRPLLRAGARRERRRSWRRVGRSRDCGRRRELRRRTRCADDTAGHRFWSDGEFHMAGTDRRGGRHPLRSGSRLRRGKSAHAGAGDGHVALGFRAAGRVRHRGARGEQLRQQCGNAFGGGDTAVTVIALGGRRLSASTPGSLSGGREYGDDLVRWSPPRRPRGAAPPPVRRAHVGADTALHPLRR